MIHLSQKRSKSRAKAWASGSCERKTSKRLPPGAPRQLLPGLRRRAQPPYLELRAGLPWTSARHPHRAPSAHNDRTLTSSGPRRVKTILMHPSALPRRRPSRIRSSWHHTLHTQNRQVKGTMVKLNLSLRYSEAHIVPIYSISSNKRTRLALECLYRTRFPNERASQGNDTHQRDPNHCWLITRNTCHQRRRWWSRPGFRGRAGHRSHRCGYRAGTRKFGCEGQ